MLWMPRATASSAYLTARRFSAADRLNTVSSFWIAQTDLWIAQTGWWIAQTGWLKFENSCLLVQSKIDALPTLDICIRPTKYKVTRPFDTFQHSGRDSGKAEPTPQVTVARQSSDFGPTPLNG
jgi:hypothetical protein